MDVNDELYDKVVVTDAGDDRGSLRDRRCRGDDLDLRCDLRERRAQFLAGVKPRQKALRRGLFAVSYTHLTLPTN